MPFNAEQLRKRITLFQTWNKQQLRDELAQLVDDNADIKSILSAQLDFTITAATITFNAHLLDDLIRVQAQAEYLQDISQALAEIYACLVFLAQKTGNPQEALSALSELVKK